MGLLQETLQDIQRRLSVAQRRRLTVSDMAVLAQATPRAIGDWMRGTTQPVGMVALMHLLAQLPVDEAQEVLAHWKNEGETDKSDLGDETSLKSL